MTDVAIAAPNEAAADAAEQAVRAGGNAVDAALAAALVTMVNEVGVVTLSAGGFVTVQPESGDAYTVDGWMDMPGRDGAAGRAGSTWDISTEYGGGIDITIGPGSVAVHGAVAALGEAQRRDGRLPWAEVVAPAIEVARTGFSLSAASRFYLAYTHESIFGWDPASRAALHDEHGAITAAPVVVPDLARSLEIIAAEGPDAMHTGELARLISADVLGRGGLLSLADLVGLRARRPPGARHPDGRLGARDGTAAVRRRSVPGSHAPAARRASARGVERRRPGRRWSRRNAPCSGTASTSSTRARTSPPTRGRFLDRIDGDPRAVLESGSTAHVSATDSDGLACSVTVSSGYGAGMIAEGTGIWLNNCLGEQELNPAGLHARPPGTRLLSNMAPTVGRRGDGAVLAIGSPGADRITTAITQVLASFVGGMPLVDAVAHPRVHVHRAGRPDEDVRVETDLTMYFGGVGVAVTAPDGTLDAAADPRRSGATRIVRTSAGR